METATLFREIASLLEGQKSNNNSPWIYGQKHDASGTPAATGYAHGPGGVLTFPGVDPMIFSAMMGAAPGILNELPTKGSVYMNPVYEIMTGIQGTTGDNKDAVCDNAPVAGLAKFCKTTAPFGRYELATREIELNRLGQRNDRADPMDLRLMNSPAFISAFGNTNIRDTFLNNEFTKALIERAVAFQRLLAVQIWTGSSANNSAGGGYREMNGFDKLINTGYVDAETGAACAAVDPIIFDFDQRIDTSGTTIVSLVSEVARHLSFMADGMNLNPVRWAIAMRPELFWELTRVWPCAYYLGGCTVASADGKNVNLDARSATELRDQMFTQRFLLVDGVRFDVVLDQGITEESNADDGAIPGGCYRSDIYFIPMSVLGGTSVTFLEYFEQNNSEIQSAIGSGMVLARAAANGAFLEWPRQTNQCFVLQAKIEPRLVMRTPWLSARITDVIYCPIRHTRSPFPDDPYFVNGGVTSRPGPSYYGD